MDKLGNGGKGIAWNTEHEVELLKQLNGVVPTGRPRGWPRSRPTSTLRDHPDAGAGDQRRSGGQGVGGAVESRPAASTRISRCPRKTRRSASATSSRSRARSSPRRSGRASRARRSATTPATPTCTN
jgi:hypothetical protein